MDRTRTVRGAAALATAGALLGLAACQPAEPPLFPTVRTSGVQASAGWTPVAGSFDRDGGDDVLWYDGDRPEQLWLSNPDGSFRKVPAPADLGPGYQPVVGDFGGDEAVDDVLWHATGEGPSLVWILGSPRRGQVVLSEVHEVELPAADTAELVHDRQSRDGVVLTTYASDSPSPQGEVHAWDADAWEEVTVVAPATGSVVEVATGDFDGDGAGDLYVLHRPRARMAWGDGAGGYEVVGARGVSGPYSPLAASIDHDSRQDLVFTSVSAGYQLPVPVWFGRADRTFHLTTQPRFERRGSVAVHGDSTFVRADTLVSYGNHGTWVWWMDRDGVVHQGPGQPEGRSLGPAHAFDQVVLEVNGGGAEDVLLYDPFDDPGADPEILLLSEDWQD